MKNFKNFLHIIIAFASLLGFLGGWATLAHSPKPVQSGTAQLEPLAPLAPIDMNPGSVAANNNSTIFVSPNRRARSRSLFMTGGS
ncbi:MAG: hypothetical protein NTW32_14325 [Chloroflexi bacterium]|nr:hypothetical protein [Chloroflexota bacterium]